MSILLKASSRANLCKFSQFIGLRGLATSTFITGNKKFAKNELPTMVEGI